MPSDARETSMSLPHADDLRGYVDYLRDLGVYDLLTQPDTATPDQAVAAWAQSNLRSAAGAAGTPRQGASQAVVAPATFKERTGSVASNRVSQPPTPVPPRAPTLSPFDQAQQRRSGQPLSSASQRGSGPSIQITPPSGAVTAPPPSAPPSTAPSLQIDAAPFATAQSSDMPAPKPFNELAPLPPVRVAPAEKPAALTALRNYIGDCTGCPLAYAGRHSIVFADGDPNARLMFVGEGPGADEDEQGLPFVGKAGQLLNNMISAMGLKREQVYIANIVKCRPPKNRVPEPVEANTCSPFLLQQIDIVQPEVIVALGGTAATYLLGVKQSLTSLRGQWFDVRGSKCAVTYHPAFLLRDPRQKGEAWKDLQRVMTELKLKPPTRA